MNPISVIHAVLVLGVPKKKFSARREKVDFGFGCTRKWGFHESLYPYCSTSPQKCCRSPPPPPLEHQSLLWDLLYCFIYWCCLPFIYSDTHFTYVVPSVPPSLRNIEAGVKAACVILHHLVVLKDIQLLSENLNLAADRLLAVHPTMLTTQPLH